MARIYISYCHEDFKFANRLAEKLRRYGNDIIVPFGSQKSIETLTRDVNSVDAFVVLITQSSQYDSWVREEIGLARGVSIAKRNINFIVPLYFPEAQMPAIIADVPHVVVDDDNPDKIGMELLIDRINDAFVEGKKEGDFSNIRMGARGELVIEAQKTLARLGNDIVVDGIFGPAMVLIVQSFQERNGLEVTGEIDEPTRMRFDALQKERNMDITSDKRYWLLAFNLPNWGADNIRIGGTAYYNTHISASEKRPEYVLYEDIKQGELILGYDFISKKAVCIFRLTNELYPNPTLGEIIQLVVEEVFQLPVGIAEDQDLKWFLDDADSRNAQRLIAISPDIFEATATAGREVKIPRSRLHAAAARLHSDDSEPEDQLQYEMYAEAIASIIKDSKVSPPPLNIAIIAPWGQGKTTLMRYIRKRFPQKEFAGDTNSTALTFGALAHWFGSSWKWVRNVRGIFLKGGVNPVVEELRKGIWKPESLQHPTVWFNPWRYQSSDQIWAGLGHAMITQLVAKLEPIHREQFWLRLRMKRVDANAIRKDIHRRIFESLLPTIVVSLLVAALLVVGAVLYVNHRELFTWIAGVSGLGFAFSCWTSLRGFFSKSLEGKFASYVREPSYSEKLGLFHEINDDLSKVCSELIGREKPAVIFIDDLDRCSPKVVTEVIEAINLMMTSDFRDRCYFVFGMDAQMVSAALDAQYSSMAGKFADKEKVHGSVGWYFLDKFIQLPFFIPVLNPVDKKAFLNRFFFSPVQPEKKEAVKNISTAQVEADATEAVQNTGTLESIKKKYEASPEALQSAMTRKLMARSKDSEEIAAEVIRYAVYLDGSPRGLKRFANLLRFYHTQQQMRTYFSTSSLSGETATTSSLAKWLVINLRWPQMVRWVQWEYEEQLIHSADPEIKAKHIDQMIVGIPVGLTADEAYGKWVLAMGKNGEHLKWLKDRDLFFLLYENNVEDSRLEKALQFDVW